MSGRTTTRFRRVDACNRQRGLNGEVIERVLGRPSAASRQIPSRPSRGHLPNAKLVGVGGMRARHLSCRVSDLLPLPFRSWLFRPTRRVLTRNARHETAVKCVGAPQRGADAGCPTANITRLLAEWQAGEGAAADEPIMLVYDEFHRLAERSRYRAQIVEEPRPSLWCCRDLDAPHSHRPRTANRAAKRRPARRRRPYATICWDDVYARAHSITSTTCWRSIRA